MSNDILLAIVTLTPIACVCAAILWLGHESKKTMDGIMAEVERKKRELAANGAIGA